MGLHILREVRQLGRGTRDAQFLNLFDLRVSVGVEATILDSATDTLKTGNDGRCFGPSPGRHLPELKSA